MDALRAYFETKFPNQAAAADYYGVTQGAIAHWVNGRRKPRPPIAMRIVADSKGRVKLQDIYPPE